MSIRIYKQRNIFVTGGTFSATTLTLDRNDGNDVQITGFTSGTFGGHEPYNADTIKWSYEINDASATVNVTPINTTVYVSANGVRTSPFTFQQDVEIKELIADITQSTGAFTGVCGIYEFVAKTGGNDANAYYQFDLAQQFTQTFNWSVGGVQTLTLSPSFTCQAGKIYVLACNTTYTGGNPICSASGLKNFGSNQILDNSGVRSFYYLETNINFPAPYTFSYVAPNLSTTIYMKQNNVYASSENFMQMKIKNA